jgi:hypothetical protein
VPPFLSLLLCPYPTLKPACHLPQKVSMSLVLTMALMAIVAPNTLYVVILYLSTISYIASGLCRVLMMNVPQNRASKFTSLWRMAMLVVMLGIYPVSLSGLQETRMARKTEARALRGCG